jgi:hypothetical protein
MLWPKSSELLCWYCCHKFDTVPCFLPHPDRSSPTGFYLSGNFCSWNCVKTYYFYACQDKRKARATQSISLLAFLTYHRPKFCPFPVTRHQTGCPCLEVYHGIPLAPKKETLHVFGGTLDIQNFRKGFMMVESIDWITRCFIDKKTLDMGLRAISASPRLRAFTYSFMVPTTSIDMVPKSKQEQEQDTQIMPILHKKQIRHRALA